MLDVMHRIGALKCKLTGLQEVYSIYNFCCFSLFFIPRLLNDSDKRSTGQASQGISKINQ